MHVHHFCGCGFSSFGDNIYPSKTAKFPFFSPWSSKNLINRNRLKTFMQVKIDELYMCTNFGGCGFSGFGDIATHKNGPISLSDHGLWSSKNSIA